MTETSQRWGAVTVVVHKVPETEEYEGGFEAATMAGVPRDVVITSPGHDSAEEALEALLAALVELGFGGRVSVQDATYLGGVQRYEVALPTAEI